MLRIPTESPKDLQTFINMVKKITWVNSFHIWVINEISKLTLHHILTVQ